MEIEREDEDMPIALNTGYKQSPSDKGASCLIVGILLIIITLAWWGAIAATALVTLNAAAEVGRLNARVLALESGQADAGSGIELPSGYEAKRGNLFFFFVPSASDPEQDVGVAQQWANQFADGAFIIPCVRVPGGMPRCFEGFFMPPNRNPD